MRSHERDASTESTAAAIVPKLTAFDMAPLPAPVEDAAPPVAVDVPDWRVPAGAPVLDPWLVPVAELPEADPEALEAGTAAAILATLAHFAAELVEVSPCL